VIDLGKPKILKGLLTKGGQQRGVRFRRVYAPVLYPVQQSL
jgi:hypothetical protein